MTIEKATEKTEDGRIAVFQERSIRRTWRLGEWWFSVVDVVEVLSESSIARRYWSDLKRKLVQEAGSEQPYEKIVRLKLTAPDGKERQTDCANTETLLRLVQSIPSPKAEPFKRWLAKVGYERIQEIENPELASARARALYEAKGYPKDRIEKRLRSIAIRGELTNEIANATFGLSPAAHTQLKGLAKLKAGNLRDHMTDLELIFTMLGEASTTEIARRKDARGFPANRRTEREGGTIAGDARRALEAKSGTPVVSAANHLGLQGKKTEQLATNALVRPVLRKKKPLRGKKA